MMRSGAEAAAAAAAADNPRRADLKTTAVRTYREVVFSFSGRQIGWFVIFWAALACVSCVLISLWKDFESSTGTHCGRKAANYLPTISSAIGGYTPQRYIWRFCMGLNSGPRLAIAIMIANYYKTLGDPSMKRRGLYTMLANLSGLLHAVENLGLVGLSFVSSTENQLIHETSYGVFLTAGELHMLITIILYKWSRTGEVMTSEERTSFRRKVVFLVLNVAACFTSVYMYVRHNMYCEPGVYTGFALLEYFCIATNICFHHTTMVVDMGHIQHRAILPDPYEHYPQTNGVQAETTNGSAQRHLVNGWHTKDD